MEEKKAITRLREFERWCKSQGLVTSEPEFEQVCGLGAKYLYNMDLKGSEIGTGIINKVYAKFNMLNIHWLVTGEGEMIKPRYGYEQGYNELKKLILDAGLIVRKVELEQKK